jgi:hypothetical protein
MAFYGYFRCFFLLLLFFIGSIPKIVITDAQTAEGAEARVTSSADPDDISRYLLDDPKQGLVEVSREQCDDIRGQVEQIFSPPQVQAPESMQTSNTTTTTIQLNVAGIGGVQQSSLPIDVVIAIDSSDSMKHNDPGNRRLYDAQTFLKKLSPTRDQSGVVSWDDDIDIDSTSPLTSNPTVTNMSIHKIDSVGDTNLDTGLNAAISILNASTRRDEPSSKAIIFFSDFEGRYTRSGNAGSPADHARSKEYKIFSFGLNIEPESREEERLKDMADASGGQYYYPPTAENLQAAFDNISGLSNTTPRNVDVIEVTENYIEDLTNFSIKPTSINPTSEGRTMITWLNVSQHVGNRDDKLSTDEIFSVNFSANVNVSSNLKELNATLPVRIKEESMVRYTDPNGNIHAIDIPQTYVNLTSQICKEQKGDFRIVLDKFIVPGSFKGIGVYEDRRSNVFKTNETIQLYVEFAGKTQKPRVDNSSNIKYLTSTTGNFTITDNEGNIVNATNENLAPFDNETLDIRDINGSGVYVFTIPGSIEPGDYVINYAITDNLSEKTEKVREKARDFIIEGEKGEFRVVNNTFTFTVPGSANCTAGVYQPHESSIFNANENIEYYVELAGMTQKRIVDNHNNSQYLTSVSATLTITDKDGNVKASPTLSDFCPSAIRFTDTWVFNNSYVFGLNPVSPPLKTGDYVMKFTITDNLSGKNDSFTKNVTIVNDGVDPLRVLENAMVAQTNATKALQNKLLKLIEEQKI